ncbi:beta-lactamase [Calothrix sp. NIES-4071]|nr:beta-lactamase [Calothrix sp. NIES-4071]BAZ56735.1 beta-lactamase [Calothrix sp. NIES-4105]
MSDSSFRLTPSSRRQNAGRRVSSRPVQKSRHQPKVAKKSQPGSKTVKPIAKTVKTTVSDTAVPVVRKNIVKSTVRPVTTSGVKSQIPPYNPNNPNNVKGKSVRVRKQPHARKTVVARRTRLKPMARNILYALRLLIVGVGIGAIVGTALSVLDPATKLNSTSGQTPTTAQPTAQATQAPTVANILQLSQEIPGLKSAIQSLAANNPNLTPGVFAADLENGSYVDFNGGAMFSSASTIKLPILIAFFQDVDEGKIDLSETLSTSKSTIVGGSGDMQNRPVGTKYNILEVATKMMIISDNTATNMLIERLGGVEKLNQRFRNWGLNTTSLRNTLPDIPGTNTTSPKELGSLMAMITKGNIVSQESRGRILEIMRGTFKDTLLPVGLGQGATIAHKTGEIGSLLADAGLVDLPSGKRYIVAVMVQRPRNDVSAEKLINGISRVVYQQFATGMGSSNPINQNNPVNPAIPNNIPANPTGVGGVAPINPIQTPVITQPLPSTNINPIPPSGYTAPIMNPMPNTYMTPLPNMGTNIPPASYQAPVVNPQYYYPYQQ